MHAVAVAEFGPLAFQRIDTWPDARFTIADGMKNGVTLRGPDWRSFLCSRSITSNPPIPLPTYAPTRGATSGVTSRPDIFIAYSLAASAKKMKRPILRTSLADTKSSGSKSVISPANRHEKPVASKCVIGAMPFFPASKAAQHSSVPTPTGETRPTPVTTTLLCKRVSRYELACFAVM